ncbi:glycosyl hydrolase [Streptomonospora sediminis]
MPSHDTPDRGGSTSSGPANSSGAADADARPQLSRRLFIGAGAAAGTAAALQPAVGLPGAAAAPADSRLAAGLADPARAVQAKFRWWWPHGMVEPAEIRREIDQIADAGFGGVEIADVHHSVDEPLDPENTGWGTERWRDALEAALSRAERRGVVVDITIGPAWPAAVPTVTPQDAAAMRELAHGVRFLAAGEEISGALPEPATAPADGVTERSLFAVQAVRLADGADPQDSPCSLVADSLVDLTSEAYGEELSWTAPGEGGATWALIAYWERGSGQRPEAGPHTEPVSYVVDHFSAAGTRAVTDFWDEHILTPRIRALLEGPAGGALFEDSIEMETDATLWTPGLPAEFEEHTGYDPLPYLPVLVRADEDKVFSFGSPTDRRATDDFNDVLSQLYIDHHLKPLKKWAHRLGLRYRIQPYGLETDAMAKAAVVDIPEGESLGFNNLDDFRSLAGGRDLGGNTVLSSEAGAVYGGSYSTTWRETARTVSREYTAGVNQAVLHGFSYADAPGARWPGFAAFTPYDGGVGYSESWGPRLPTWQHAADVAGFLARSQHGLQWGTSTADVAFLRQKGYAGSGFGAAYFSKEGVRIGWTHQFVSPRLLEITDPDVEDGVLAPDGPAYNLLVFEGDAFSGRVPTLPLETARRLLRYAKRGLRIVVVSDWSSPQQPGVDQDGAAELAETVQALLGQPTVHRVAAREDIAEGIAALGAAPGVRYAQDSPLLHARRRSRHLDLYHLANGSDDTAVDHDVTFSTGIRHAYPFAIDLWTGGITPLPLHRAEDGGIRLRVRLAPGAATAVAIARPQWAKGAGKGGGKGGHGIAPGQLRKLRFDSTDADSVHIAGGTAKVRAASPGSYTTTGADGRTVTTAIDSVGDKRELTRWRLEVEDWRPGGSATETEVRTHELDLDGLAPWTELDGLADVSGIGRYTATVELGKGWTGGHGAYLDLGRVTDLFRVSVNGKDLPPADQLDPVVDLGDRLHSGTNTIEVEVSTTLINRMRAFRPDVYGDAARQECGLLGPVRLLPYGQADL